MSVSQDGAERVEYIISFYKKVQNRATALSLRPFLSTTLSVKSGSGMGFVPLSYSTWTSEGESSLVQSSKVSISQYSISQYSNSISYYSILYGTVYLRGGDHGDPYRGAPLEHLHVRAHGALCNVLYGDLTISSPTIQTYFILLFIFEIISTSPDECPRGWTCRCLLCMFVYQLLFV